MVTGQNKQQQVTVKGSNLGLYTSNSHLIIQLSQQLSLFT